jgi:hypothetical protein
MTATTREHAIRYSEYTFGIAMGFILGAGVSQRMAISSGIIFFCVGTAVRLYVWIANESESIVP